jgi:outer membrane lipoprotein-sorting protein
MRVSVLFRSAAIALAIGSVSVVTASAQTVDELVSKHIAARGGYDKLKAIETVRITRTVGTPFTTVKVVIYKKRPDLIRWEQTPKGQTEAVPRAINTTVAWDMAQGKVVTRPEPIAVEGRETDGDFDGLLVDWQKKGHTVSLEGKQKVGSADTYKLKVTTKGGTVREVYLDATTFLEAQVVGRVRLPAIDPRTKEHRYNDTIFLFSDYRDVNGVKFPFAVDEERTGGGITQSFAHFTEKIEVNVPVDDSLFAAPQAAGDKGAASGFRLSRLPALSASGSLGFRLPASGFRAPS